MHCVPIKSGLDISGNAAISDTLGEFAKLDYVIASEKDVIWSNSGRWVF